MSEVVQLFQSGHRGQLHVCETHALNAQLPVYAIEGLALHDLAVLAQHLVVDGVCAVLLGLELHELGPWHMVQPH